MGISPKERERENKRREGELQDFSLISLKKTDY